MTDEAVEAAALDRARTKAAIHPVGAVIGTLLVINVTAVIGGIFIGWWLRSVTMQDHSMVGPPAGNPQDAGTVTDARECGGSQ